MPTVTLTPWQARVIGRLVRGDVNGNLIIEGASDGGRTIRATYATKAGHLVTTNITARKPVTR